MTCPDWAYNNRNMVERLWARLKQWRAVATRYEKTARSFPGVLCLAAAIDWIRRKQPGTVGLQCGGAGGIRTLDTVLPYTHFPGERLRPLGHRSAGPGGRLI